MSLELAGSEPANKNMEIDTEDNQAAISALSQGNKDKNVNIETADSVYDFSNKYSHTDSGPFYVFVEHKNKSLGKLFPIRVGYYLRLANEFKRSIQDIKSVGRNRVKVIVDNFKSANEMVNNELLTRNGLVAYVPKFYTQKKGVIRMVDTFFSNDFLFQNIESSKKVLEVKRLERKIVDNDGKEKIVQRQIIVVSFLGNEIPRQVRINGVNFPVEPYITPVIQCRKCLRYGHITKVCQKTDSCCSKCSLVHPEGECDDQPMCIYCKSGDHSSISRQCPIYLKQKRIKERMARQNLSFKEAEALENNPSYNKIVSNNRFNLLNNIENFPELPATSVPYQSVAQRPKPLNDNRKNKIQHGSQNKSSTKRKAARSPIPGTPVPIKEPRLVIPNPHAPDFREYKEKLINRLQSLFEEITSRIQGDNALFSFNFKDNLNAILTDIETNTGDDNTGNDNHDRQGDFSDSNSNGNNSDKDGDNEFF